MATKHLTIKGRVQGVFYRATAKEVATKLGLTGWVRNTGEGHVEALVSGEEERINKFVEWCWQGPKAAAVTGVEMVNAEEQNFGDFAIVRG